MANKRFTDEEIIQALHDSYGIMTQAANRLGCSDKTIQRAVQANPDVAMAREDARKQIVDLAEHQLIGQIREGNIAAILFTLKTLGRSRGYSERHEIGLALSAEVTHLVSQLGIDKQDVLREFEALVREEAKRLTDGG